LIASFNRALQLTVHDAKYLQAALDEWRSGRRNNHPTQQMPMIAKALVPEDIAALAQYYGSKQPPKPVAALVVFRDARATDVKSRGTTPSVPTDQPSGSAGVEQGTGTRGGSQGPGGSGETRNNQAPGH